MSLQIPISNLPRGSATLLFQGVPFLLDDERARQTPRIGRMQRLLMGLSMEEPGAAVGDVLNACKKETYKPSKSPQGPSKASQHVECPICLEAFQTNDVILRLPCNHPFHVDCLLPWIRSNHSQCPFCRAEIITKQSWSSMAAGARNTSASTANSTSDNIREISISSHSSTAHSTRDIVRDIPISSHSRPLRTVPDQRQPFRRPMISSQGSYLPELSNPNPFTLTVYPINITFSN